MAWFVSDSNFKQSFSVIAHRDGLRNARLPSNSSTSSMGGCSPSGIVVSTVWASLSAWLALANFAPSHCQNTWRYLRGGCSAERLSLACCGALGEGLSVAGSAVVGGVSAPAAAARVGRGVLFG